MNDLRRVTNMINNYSVTCSEKADKPYLFQIKVVWISIVTLFSVLATFVFCVLWTVFFKLEDATSTHCGYRVCLYFRFFFCYIINYYYRLLKLRSFLGEKLFANNINSRGQLSSTAISLDFCDNCT